jgi:hypothetical protein
MKNKNSTRGRGRPRAEITIPNRKFTFADFGEANQHVTPLTLRKFIKYDFAKKNKSEIIKLKDETREPNSKEGLGRKTFVYIRRNKANSLKTARKSKMSVSLSTPQNTKKTSTDYEATKAALGLNAHPPVTAPATAPVTDTAPVTA